MESPDTDLLSSPSEVIYYVLQELSAGKSTHDLIIDPDHVRDFIQELSTFAPMSDLYKIEYIDMDVESQSIFLELLYGEHNYIFILDIFAEQGILQKCTFVRNDKNHTDVIKNGYILSRSDYVQ
ncbi:hypothetical protein KC669_00500 [Candidatus Dojkabacteria bacterium]|uniref:Uncharacterized protein n=1 Tax=Candidatus Dojkabacteria bacterium TaxID=2099670 RepID=A0A955L9D9_9BACT|nr:hypothetical protein [Candidatus Dojkabacteria bacterium]